MLRCFLLLLVATTLSIDPAFAQDDEGNESGQGSGETSTEQPDQAPDGEISETVAGHGERLNLVENDLAILKSIKVSGYVQTEWQHFDQKSNAGRAVPGFFETRKNLFTVRRGRIKFQHKLGEIMSYTIQPDITERGVEIKDAFLELNFLPLDQFNVDVGMFNRPNYEVELSSSARESAERSQVVRAFYPGERDLGVMLSSRYPIAEGFDPKIQVGLFNGPGAPRAEVDAYKDIIARLTFPIPIGYDSPIQVDLGASIYYGGIPQTDSLVRKTTSGETKAVVNDETGSIAGFGNNKNINVEGQIYLDLLPFGGTTIKGEFLSGSRATAGNPATSASIAVGKDSAGRNIPVVNPGTAATTLQIRNQSGFYLYFIQNIENWLQLVAKYDVFDRNTDMEGTQVLGAGDAASQVLGVGANFFYENLRLTLWYEIPSFATDENIQVVSGSPSAALRTEDLKDNKTTIRFQYKF